MPLARTNAHQHEIDHPGITPDAASSHGETRLPRTARAADPSALSDSDLEEVGLFEPNQRDQVDVRAASARVRFQVVRSEADGSGLRVFLPRDDLSELGGVVRAVEAIAEKAEYERFYDPEESLAKVEVLARAAYRRVSAAETDASRLRRWIAAYMPEQLPQERVLADRGEPAPARELYLVRAVEWA